MVNQRTAGVVLALREAAASDADPAERRREREQRRRINVEQGAALVAGRAVTAGHSDRSAALTDDLRRIAAVAASDAVLIGRRH